MSEPSEVKSDTRTARDLAGAESALRRAGWKRAIDLPVSNPSLSGRIEEFERDYEAFARVGEKFAKPNPVVEFFNTAGGAEAMKQLIPVLVGKLFGGGAAPALVETVQANPVAGEIAGLGERVAAIEEMLVRIAEKVEAATAANDAVREVPKRRR